MIQKVEDYLKENDLNIVQVYQTNLSNISFDRKYLEQQADGKSSVFKVFVLVDDIDLEALQNNNDIYYEKSGFETKAELEDYILSEMIR